MRQFSRGGGQNIAYAAESVKPSNPSSGNTVELNDNTYTINGETTSHDGTFYEFDAGYSSSGDANNNTLTVNGGRVTVFLNGGYAVNTNYNKVTINNGTFDDWVEGGWATYGNANYNEMIINGGTFNSGFIVDGGYTGTGDTNYNTVTINGGTFNYGGIYGGYVAGSGNAIGNTITINGGTINGTVYSGYVGGTGNVQDNTINIYGSPDLTNATLIAARSATYSSGNNINIYTSGITAKNIGGFENLNFYIPSNIDTQTPILTLTDTSGTNLTSTKVNIGALGSQDVIPNSNITLLTNGAGITTDENVTFGNVLSQGVSVFYPVDIVPSADGTSIVAQIGSNGEMNGKVEIIEPIIPNPPSLDIPEMDETFPEFDLNDEQKKLGNTDSPDNKGWNVFGDVGGGQMRYKMANGAYADTTSQNIDMGFARSIDRGETDKMTLAPVIDYQNTNFDNYLSDGTHGSGNSKYIGAGFVLRNINHNGFYYEGSFRFGRNSTDFASDDLDTTGEFGTVSYTADSSIYSGHIKLGKYLRLNKNNLLNIYGFYHHTLQGSTSTDLSSGEHYDFSSANSGRARIGYRLTTRTSKISQIYTGLAYQFEYNTGVSAKYKEYSTSGSSYNGSSGMLELGWLVKPLKNAPWVVDVNATGWIGYQRGVKATAKIQKSF